MTGLCECGCGTATRPAPRNETARRWVKGRPLRFARGHAARVQPKVSIEDRWRFLPNGCWEWQGHKIEGYGYWWDAASQRNVRVHRYTYEQLIGPIPEGLTLDHLCRNRACVNTKQWSESNHSRRGPDAAGPMLMGMPWATYDEAKLAIPPSYTEWIGVRLLAEVDVRQYYASSGGAA